MSLTPISLPTETQADVPGSPYYLSPICFHSSPQPYPHSPLIVQSPNQDADFYWNETYFEANNFPSKPDIGGISPSLLHGGIVEQHSSYDTHTPSPVDHFSLNPPSASEYDGGSTPSISNSSVMLTPPYTSHNHSSVDLVSSNHPSTNEFDGESDPSTSPSPVMPTTPYDHNPHTLSSIDLFQWTQSPISEFDGGSPPYITSPVMLAPNILSPCICGCGGSACLPQRPYRRPKGDPLEDDEIGQLITFQVNGRCGMPLRNALRGYYHGLHDRDEPMFVGNRSRSSISIRIEWPDCSPWAQQMRTKDWRRKPSPIPKSKLAMEVAKKVDRFLRDTRRAHRGSRGDALSPCDIDVNRLVLVALEHVSLASWQPHLRLI